MKYKLIALDMDGTVLDEHHQIPEENRKWIAKARESGVHVMFATGRGFQSMIKYVDQLQLQDTPFVTVNGGEVWRNSRQLHFRKLLAVDVVEQLREVALEHGIWYWAYSVEGVWNKDKWPEELSAYRWLKFGYQSEDQAALRRAAEAALRIAPLELTNSHPTNLELNPAGINKAAGIREVCGLLGIEMEQVVAMGDSLNDLAMIREVGLGVAMGNAQDEVKRQAKVVAPKNTEFGVAQIIRDLVLQ